MWPALLSGARQHIADLRAQHAQELEEQRLSHEARLEELRREAGRLTDQNKTFRALMESGREESRFEVRKDMLLEIGDILQRTYRPGKNPEDRLEEVAARLPIALKEGGAEPLGTVGDTVPYDSRFHHSEVGISLGTMVYLSTPGVVVRGRTTSDRVILKADVVCQSEIS